jgi:hypothetical protein
VLRGQPEGDAGGDVAGIVGFGRRRSSSGCRRRSARSIGSPRRRSGSATDIGARSRLASALFPDDAQKRIVLVSDGNDTTGSGQSEAALAAARGIQVETRAIGLGAGRRGPRRALTTPSTSRIGEEIEAIATSARPSASRRRPALRRRRPGRRADGRARAGSNR